MMPCSILLYCFISHAASSKVATGTPPSMNWFSLIRKEQSTLNGQHGGGGVGTSDDGFVAAGTGGGTGGRNAGFLIKVNKDGQFQWVYKHESLFTEEDKNYVTFNGVVEGPASDNHALYAAGITYTASDGYDRFLVKVSKDGKEVWKATFPDPVNNISSKKHAAWEMMSMDPSTGDVYLSGFVNKDGTSNIGEFKSGGNPDGCIANVAKITGQAMQRSTAPTTSDFVFDRSDFGELGHFVSGTSIRALSAGGAVFTSRSKRGTPDSVTNQIPQVMRLRTDGTTTWTKAVMEAGEITDIAVAPDESFYIANGHRQEKARGSSRLSSFTRIEASDGAVTWAKYYGDTNPFVNDECWGVTMVNDADGLGAIAACGEGQESIPNTCDGDHSPEALHRLGVCSKGGQSPTCAEVKTYIDAACKNFMFFKTSTQRVSAADGSLMWIHEHQHHQCDNIPENTAAEWIAPGVPSAGGFIIITDNDNGVGFLRIQSARSAPPAPPPAPTPPCVDSPAPPPAPCIDNDKTVMAATGGETCATLRSECTNPDNEAIRKACPKTCCECPGERRLAGTTCAPETSQVMSFESVWPMSWALYSADIQETMEAVKNGSTFTEAQQSIWDEFSQSMSLQVRQAVATSLGMPLEETDGLCVYLLGDPEMTDMGNNEDSCGGSFGMAETDSTVVEDVASTDGLGLAALLTRDVMIDILHPHTEPLEHTSKSNAELMTAVMARINQKFNFSYAGVSSSSKCHPYRYSSLSEASPSAKPQSSSSPSLSTSQSPSNSSLSEAYPSAKPQFLSSPSLSTSPSPSKSSSPSSSTSNSSSPSTSPDESSAAFCASDGSSAILAVLTFSMMLLS
eukprot:TRINITY_DN5103_c0_g1_i1.p1 TRINITY_DN5103_c0_g1~~TRINITY_DN5103_c0_g1_i1.p1  ORF type:complete len:849 (+),score=121.76 TRINITY_DN5103_c0_g1_i1:58-2604(+)